MRGTALWQLVVGVASLAMLLSSCTGTPTAGHGSSSSTSSSASGTSLGTVCGYKDFVGGPSHAAPLRVLYCPSGLPDYGEGTVLFHTAGAEQSLITLTRSTGEKYWALFDGRGLWSAQLPAGVYHAVGSGCPLPGMKVVVRAGQTLVGVRVDVGCAVP